MLLIIVYVIPDYADVLRPAGGLRGTVGGLTEGIPVIHGGLCPVRHIVMVDQGDVLIVDDDADQVLEISTGVAARPAEAQTRDADVVTRRLKQTYSVAQVTHGELDLWTQGLATAVSTERHPGRDLQRRGEIGEGQQTVDLDHGTGNCALQRRLESCGRGYGSKDRSGLAAGVVHRIEVPELGIRQLAAAQDERCARGSDRALQLYDKVAIDGKYHAVTIEVEALRV